MYFIAIWVLWAVPWEYVHIRRTIIIFPSIYFQLRRCCWWIVIYYFSVRRISTHFACRINCFYMKIIWARRWKCYINMISIWWRTWTRGRTWARKWTWIRKFFYIWVYACNNIIRNIVKCVIISNYFYVSIVSR